MREITFKEVLERLRLDNPWWFDAPSIRSQLRKWPRRDYFDPFFQLLSNREVNRAVILMGSRRVGKTVMVRNAG